MPKPISAGKQASSAAPRMSVVLLTMDSHLASAAESAAERLARDLPGLHLQTHSASAWRDSETALANCLAAVAQADIVIVTMLFMEDHFLPVMDALKARREHCDAMVCIMSAPPVMQLTRMGKFSLGGQSGGLMGLLKKLRPSAKTSGEGQAPAASAGAAGHLLSNKRFSARPAHRGRVENICVREGGPERFCRRAPGLSMALAQELATKGVTVNTVSPGYIGTDMVRAIKPEVLEKIVATIPVKRLGTPEEIGSIVAWLAGDDSGFTTGADFSCNGGLHMG